MLDGLGTIESYVERADEIGMPALAITDHGNVCGLPPFYWECRKTGIEPILGEEFYFVPSVDKARASKKSKKEEKKKDRYHVVLLAKDEAGVQVLSNLSTESHRRFYYKPLLERSLLEQLGDDAKHLICLSGCAGSIISNKAMHSKKAVLKEVKWWKKIFPNFYIEIQHHDIDQDEKLNGRLIQVARKLDLPIVITNDPHYVREEDAEHHDALLAIQTVSDLDDPDRFRFDGHGYHLRTRREMRSAFQRYDKQVWKEGSANTLQIARDCKINIPSWERRTWHIPKFPDTDDPYRTLKRLALRSLRSRGLDENPEYKNRLKEELKKIKQVGISDFLLITRDCIEWAKEQGIPVGPGRGSVCGVLTGYLIGIHKVDSVRYNLLFERFLNPDRPKMPDIDTDFAQSRRDELLDYVREKYGERNIVQVAAYQTMKVKSAFHALAGAHGIEFKDRLNLSKQIEEDDEGDVAWPEEIRDNYSDLIEQMDNLVGLKKSFSSHPAGVLILSEGDEIREMIPEMWVASSKKMIGQFDLDTVTELGLLKQDYLGLRTLDTIWECVRLVEKRHGDEIDPDSWSPDEEEGDRFVYKMLASGRTNGVFQMEGGTNAKGIQSINPKEFEDIVACTALYRAGPIMAGAPDRFLKNKRSKKLNVIHPAFEEILKDTWGEMIYDEQMFRILNEIAGFSWARVDDAKTAMKKKDPEKMAALKEDAVEGFMTHGGLPRMIANQAWDMIESQARYLFNRSHAVAYSLITYQTARLKCLYQLEFITALMRTVDGSTKENKAKRFSYLSEAKQAGFKIFPPDINTSERRATCHGDNRIMFGLQDIKGVGIRAADKILKSRPRKGFKNSEEVRQVVGNIGIFKALVEAGALRRFGKKYRSSDQRMEESLEWQFRDPMENYRDKYFEKFKKPKGDKSTVRIYGQVATVERRKTKSGRDFVVWTVRWAPGEEYRVNIWEDACERWDIKKGSIVRVKGDWSQQWNNISVGDPEQVKVLKYEEPEA